MKDAWLFVDVLVLGAILDSGCLLPANSKEWSTSAARSNCKGSKNNKLGKESN